MEERDIEYAMSLVDRDHHLADPKLRYVLTVKVLFHMLLDAAMSKPEGKPRF